MTDLEMTQLCAEAMGIKCSVLADVLRINPYHNDKYDPLYDDAQAMALVKKFSISIVFHEVNAGAFHPAVYLWDKENDDLNREIVTHVANMQRAKDAA